MAIFSSKKEEKNEKSSVKKEGVKAVAETKKKETAVQAAVSKSASTKSEKKHEPILKGNVEGAYELIIHRPRITEKAARVTENNVYVFDVSMRATKKDIVTAIHEHYKVTPIKVNIVRLAPRKLVSRARNRVGKASGMKKAYVFLKEGERIDII